MIDKGFINDEMLHLCPEVTINYLLRSISDHTPLVVRFFQQEQPRSKPFKFLNIIADDDRFIPTVQEAWRSCNGRHMMKHV